MAIMQVPAFVAITQVTVSVAIIQLEVFAAFMRVKVSAANMWVTVSMEIMHAGVFAATMQDSWKTSEGRSSSKFAFHHFSKYSSKIKICCG